MKRRRRKPVVCSAAIYKQLYVKAGANAPMERVKTNLQRSFDAYALAWAEDPKVNIWHGINLVALLARADREHIDVRGATDYRALAQTILKILEDKEANAADGLPAWDLATQMEALVALGQFARSREDSDGVLGCPRCRRF